MEVLVLLISAAASVGLLAYSIHGGVAFMRFLLARRAQPRPTTTAGVWRRTPVITTQIPLCNDGALAAERTLRAAAALTYPGGSHEIQVLDDSTDDTRTTVDRIVRELRQHGHRVAVVRRQDRKGGRAGALGHGLRQSAGELVVVLDSQLAPPADFLLRVVPLFLEDDRLGFVQAAARHAESLAVRARPAGDRTSAVFPALTAGETWTGVPGNACRSVAVWRRGAIDEARGWEGDTTAADLDLSYRVRICGWRVRHLADGAVWAEQPNTVTACELAQVRWARGSIQTARKLLPRIWQSSLRRKAKVAATLHLTEPAVYPLMLVNVLFAVPAAATAGILPVPLRSVFIGLLVAALLVPHALYLATQQLLYPQWWRRITAFPALVCVGVGAAVANSRAVFEALRGRGGIESRPRQHSASPSAAVRGPGPAIAWIEVAVGAYCAIGLGLYLSTGRLVLAPLLFGYAVGFLVTGVAALHEAYDDRARRLHRILGGRRGPGRAEAIRGFRARPAA